MTAGSRRRCAGLLTLLLAGAACAHVEPPRGGPIDETPPQLLVTRPDSLAVVPGFTGPVVLVFDERLSERGLQDAVMVSPRTSMVRTSHRGDELRVQLERGWQPGLIYQVIVRPDIRDLFGNQRTEPIEFVFSTGPEIPETVVTGRVIDRITGQPEREVRVEAIRQADSLVYAVPTDTAGNYAFRRIPEGEYRVRAFRDLNRNRALDEFEPRDSALVTVAAGDSATARFAILMPDTTPPQIASIAVVQERLEIRFDDFLDPEQVVSPGRVQILAEGRFVTVDSVRVAPPTGGAAPRAPAPAAEEEDAPPPLPSQVLLVHLSDRAQVEEGVEYTVSVRGIRNVHGLVGDAQGTFTGPEAPPAPAAPEPDPEP